MIRRIIEDAVELARTAVGDSSPRSVLRTVLLVESFRMTAVQRLREAAAAARVPLANHLLRYVQTVVWGLEIDKTVTLGRGVYVVHPFGVVIGGTSRVGDRVRFYGDNTVGTIHDDGYPVIEDDVWIGAGARILGPVRVGAGARIGANAVVISDVPPGHVAVGVPARILAPRERRPGARERGRLRAAEPAGAE